jgi:hypothetical protein
VTDFRNRHDGPEGAVANFTPWLDSWYHFCMTARKKPPKLRPVAPKKLTPPLQSNAEATREAEAEGAATYHDTHTHLFIADVAGKTDDEIGDLIDAIIDGSA